MPCGYIQFFYFKNAKFQNSLFYCLSCGGRSGLPSFNEKVSFVQWVESLDGQLL